MNNNCKISNHKLKHSLVFVCALAISFVACSQVSKSQTNKNESMETFNALTPEEEYIIVNKGTERPFSGEYCEMFSAGTYVCKRCNAPLYLSQDKFASHCGWPSFDDEISGAVLRIPDADGRRTEIQCAACKAHLGHVFEGEGFTAKNTRHCVNSLSLKFIPQPVEASNDTAIFAGGCFWGMQYWFEKQDGVLSTTVGYCGGVEKNPTYELVCSHTTHYAEVVAVVYDTKKIQFEDLARLFFNIHDPTQYNRQGPDVGEQYRSAVFYTSDEQKRIVDTLLHELQQKGIKAVTQVTKATPFWPAEQYHQNYYKRKGSEPYCHVFVKRL